MRAELRFVPATAEHAAELARTMRAGDRAEAWAIERRAPLDALLDALSRSSRAWTAFVDGEVAAMFGVIEIDLLTRTGSLWFLTGAAVDAHKRVLLRAAPPTLAALRREWDVLLNVVDARYAGALSLLRWLGAEIHPPEPMGPGGVPFRRFLWRNDR